MKKFFMLGFLLILLGITYYQKENLLDIYNDLLYEFTKKEVSLNGVNEYYRDYDFMYVQNTNNFNPEDKQDILNIYYTVINAGKDEFTFYCPSEYKECINDVNSLANNQTILSHINNFVHPFNGFKNIETKYDSLGKVTINIQKSYNETQIKQTLEKVNEIKSEVFNDKLSTLDNIRNVHDYIINHSKYDSERSDNNIVNYKSDIAYGPLIEGYGLCGGYTDAMEIFLEELGIRSFKVSSDNHIWNAVYYNNTWLHLDLTWDDPVTSNGTDELEHDFFLISTDKLKEIEPLEHSFDLDVYQEFN